MGWLRAKNGELFALLRKHDFDGWITIDKGIPA